MKIQLLLKNIIVSSGTIKPSEKIFLDIKIGDNINFTSGDVTAQNKTYYFLERNIIEIQDQLIDYVSFELKNNQTKIAHKTVFMQEAIENTIVYLIPSIGTETFKLTYQLSIKNNDRVSEPKSEKQIKNEEPNYSDENGKIKILKMGVLVYDFVQRLDPLLKFVRLLNPILTWKQPILTILLGFCLTFLIFYPKLSIVLFSLMIMAGRKQIMNKLQELQVSEDISKRLLIPNENIIFLKELLQAYCLLFDKGNTFLRQKDKGNIVNTTKNISKACFILIVLSIVLPLQLLLLGLVWGFLLLLSPYKNAILKHCLPRICEINHLIEKMENKLGQSRIGKVIKIQQTSPHSIVKELHIYQYQRWWIGKEWGTSYWSDEKKEPNLLARNQCPNNWKWMQNWKIEYNEDRDEEGYEYSNDFKVGYTKQNFLKTIRRRKWIRKCIITFNKWTRQRKRSTSPVTSQIE